MFLVRRHVVVVVVVTCVSTGRTFRTPVVGTHFAPNSTVWADVLLAAVASNVVFVIRGALGEALVFSTCRANFHCLQVAVSLFPGIAVLSTAETGTTC